MRLLAIEASTTQLSVALWHDGNVLQQVGSGNIVHTEEILVLLRRLLGDAQCGVRDMDAIAFGAGPGGFTGVRLACAAAQGLAMAMDLPVVAVGSLGAVAAASAQARCYVCTDARMSEVYFAAYRRTGDDLVAVIEPGVSVPGEVGIPMSDTWFGCGSGFAQYGDALRVRLGAYLAGSDGTVWPQARWIAALGAAQFAAGKAMDPVLAAPRYVRTKVALTTAERAARSMGHGL